MVFVHGDKKHFTFPVVKQRRMHEMPPLLCFKIGFSDVLHLAKISLVNVRFDSLVYFN